MKNRLGNAHIWLPGVVKAQGNYQANNRWTNVEAKHQPTAGEIGQWSVSGIKNNSHQQGQADAQQKPDHMQAQNDQKRDGYIL